MKREGIPLTAEPSAIALGRTRFGPTTGCAERGKSRAAWWVARAGAGHARRGRSGEGQHVSVEVRTTAARQHLFFPTARPHYPTSLSAGGGSEVNKFRFQDSRGDAELGARGWGKNQSQISDLR